ncbi:MAG: acetolactate synthase small subunit [Deltaproteobacteria bacterium]|nr:acetolactate synthase small subunit [Deltaproteobacteria bacterium]
MEVKEHTISLLVNNKPDVLARIAGTFSGRGYNIENISANVTLDPKITKINIVTVGNSATIVQIEKQLKKLVDVIDAFHVKSRSAVQRELILVRVEVSQGDRGGIIKAIEEFGCRVLKEGSGYFILELTGSKEEVDQALTYLETLGMKNMSRSGRVVL